MVMSPVGCQLNLEKFVRKGNESVTWSVGVIGVVY